MVGVRDEEQRRRQMGSEREAFVKARQTVDESEDEDGVAPSAATSMTGDQRRNERYAGAI